MLVKVVRYFTEGNLNQHKSRKAELLYCTLCNIRNIDGNILGMLDTIHIIHLLYNYNIHYVYNVYIVHCTQYTLYKVNMIIYMFMTLFSSVVLMTPKVPQ